MTKSLDDRPPLVLAMQWVSRVTTISLEMVLPGLLGYWADQQWNSEPVLLVLGVILGFSVGMWHLVKLAKWPPRDPTPPPELPNGPEKRV